MHIGILTYHSQLNYGGVLQAFALQTYLEKQGHHVEIIDRWFNYENYPLNGYLKKNILKKRFWGQFLFSGEIGGYVKRIKNTNNFIRSKLRLTSYHFVDWGEARETDIDFDLIIVGSDQIWNPCGNISPYLLQNIPKHIPAISYAGSFGTNQIPAEKIELYRNGFRNFKSLSAREKSGINIIEQLGFSAEHVCDPVLLLSAKDWKNILNLKHREENKLVCYFLSEQVESALPYLKAFSEKNGVFIEILVMPFETSFYHPNLLKTRKILSQLRSHRITLNLSAGPVEFLQAISSAKYILSDSFHALMFSALFNKNIRIIYPKDWRVDMLSRIEEWMKKYIIGDLLTNDVASGVDDLAKGLKIQYNNHLLESTSSKSQNWLKKNLEFTKIR